MRQPSPEKVQALSERQVKLTDLTKAPGWKILSAGVEAKKALYEKNLLARHLSAVPTAEPVNQRDLDYWRGYFAGQRDLISSPEKAEKTLEVTLKLMEG